MTTVFTAPMSSVPVRVIVTPGIPGSPGSWMPLPFRSTKTVPPRLEGTSSPKLLPTPSVDAPTGSTRFVRTLAGGSAAVPPCEPTVFFPLR